MLQVHDGPRRAIERADLCTKVEEGGLRYKKNWPMADCVGLTWTLPALRHNRVKTILTTRALASYLIGGVFRSSFTSPGPANSTMAKGKKLGFVSIPRGDSATQERSSTRTVISVTLSRGEDGSLHESQSLRVLDNRKASATHSTTESVTHTSQPTDDALHGIPEADQLYGGQRKRCGRQQQHIANRRVNG